MNSVHSLDALVEIFRIIQNFIQSLENLITRTEKGTQRNPFI